MVELAVLEKGFVYIMARMVETGVAPHYTELAAELGFGAEDGRQVVHGIMATGFPGWVHPDTDWIASFPPFSNIPTQYRITVYGQQKWYAQCGFESLAVCWLFPGKRVRIDFRCLDCNQPLVIEMQEGVVLSAQSEIVGHTNRSWAGPPGDWARR